MIMMMMMTVMMNCQIFRFEIRYFPTYFPRILLSLCPLRPELTACDELLTAAAVCKGVIESDDIAALSLEIEKALNYCKKCNLLVESVKRKDTLVCGCFVY